MTLYLRDVIVAKNTAYKCVLTTFCPFCKEMYFSRDNGKKCIVINDIKFFLDFLFHLLIQASYCTFDMENTYILDEQI